jgi:hypothetical protein
MSTSGNPDVGTELGTFGTNVPYDYDEVDKTNMSNVKGCLPPFLAETLAKTMQE